MNEKQNLEEKALSDIKKDFIAMGSHRIHGWYAWAIVGIVVGMAWGIVYVSSWSNRLATFDASQAQTAIEGAAQADSSKLWFAPAERSGETNPMLIVYSQSQGPVSFSYALAGSNDFQPLDGDFNWDQVSAEAPYQFTFIPSIFADHRARSDDPESNEIIPAVSAGTYTIRVIQDQSESEPSEPTAQAINIGLPNQNPFPAPLPVPAPPGAAKHPFVLFSDFIFRFGGFPGGFGGIRGVGAPAAQQPPYKTATKGLSSCESINLEDIGSIDSYFNSTAGGNVSRLNGKLGLFFHYPNDDSDAGFINYAFQIRGFLKKSVADYIGSTPFPQIVRPQQGQMVKDEFETYRTRKVRAYDYQTQKIVNQLLANSDLSRYFPFTLSGDRYMDDDYHGPFDEGIVANLSDTQQILWLDAPGFDRLLGFNKYALPLKIEFDFYHYIRGSSGDGSRDGAWDCKYSWHDDCVATIETTLQAIGASYTKVNPPQALGNGISSPWTQFVFKSPSCLCNSHLILSVDKNGKATYNEDNDCKSNFGGKAGSLAQTDQIDDLLKNHYGPPSRGGTGSSGSGGSTGGGATGAW